MKYTLFFLFLLLLSVKSFSQEYMDKIASKSCACVEAVPDSLETRKFNMQFGLCMFEAAMPYSKQLKKDYGIDLERIDTEGEKLGRLIGVKMASVCPNILVKISERVKGKSEGTTEQTVKGTVTKIEKDFFVVFTVKDESGKSGKYYWLSYIKTDSDLVTTYGQLIDKPVEIVAEARELFDPKIEEYRQFLVIKKITIVQ